MSSPDPAGECYEHYKQLFDRPPTVVELWDWMSAADKETTS